MRLPFLLLTTSLLAACAGAPAPSAAPAPAEASPEAASSRFPTIVRGSLPPPRVPSSTATPAPASTTAPAPAEGTTVISGLVLSESGNPLYGAGVSVQSLDPQRPFSERVIAEKGRYEIRGVPVGVLVKVGANIRFHDPRSIMHTTSAEPAANIVDFAGPFALPKT